MPKRTKKRTARSHSSRQPKIKTYPRLAILVIVLLTMVGLGYVWVYYNKINVRTPEIMDSCPAAKCDRQEDKCKDSCKDKYPKGDDRTTCINVCKQNRADCERHPCGWKFQEIKYSCSAEKPGDCTIGDSTECQNNANGTSHKFVCRQDLNNPARGCYVKETYGGHGCQLNQGWGKCGDDGPVGDCYKKVSYNLYMDVYEQQYCINGRITYKCYKDAACSQEIDCDENCDCERSQYNTCVSIGKLCQNDCKVVDDDRCKANCYKLKRCSAIGSNCQSDQAGSCDESISCDKGYTKCIDDTGGNFTQKCCKP